MRSIQTTYYLGNKIRKINYALHSRSAVLRAVDHMQMNDYGAQVADVFDLETGQLYAVIKYGAGGRLQILFEADPRKPVCGMVAL